MRVDEKLDRLLMSSQNQTHSSSDDLQKLEAENRQLQEQLDRARADVDAIVNLRVKSVLNKVFKTVKSEINKHSEDETFNNAEVLALIGECLKQATEKVLKPN